MTENHQDNESLTDKANAAFRKVATKVVEIARQTGTPVIVWKDGRVQEVSPDQIAEHRKVDGDEA